MPAPLLLRITALLIAPLAHACNFDDAAIAMFSGNCAALMASTAAGFCTAGHPFSPWIGYFCGTSCGLDDTMRATYPTAYTYADNNALWQRVEQYGLFTPNPSYAFYGYYGDADATIPGKQVYYQCSDLLAIATFWGQPLSSYCTPVVSTICPVSYDAICVPNGFPPKATASACAALPAPVTATKDPHFRLPHGGRTDIRGEDGGIYSLLSAKNLAFNAQFAAADFQWNKRLVHGTKMAAAYWTVRTHSNQTVTIAYAAVTAKGGHANITVDGSAEKRVTEAHGKFELSDLMVSLTGRKLTVETNQWRMIAGVNPFPFASLNKGKILLDIELYPLYEADKDTVAPHGIFGQAYDDDDLAIDGAVDKATKDEMTTTAQGEGAIEGVLADYKVAAPFVTAFKYSRFDAVAAPHRDTSKLTGLKRRVGKTVRSVADLHHEEVELVEA